MSSFSQVELLKIGHIQCTSKTRPFLKNCLLGCVDTQLNIIYSYSWWFQPTKQAGQMGNPPQIRGENKARI